MRHPLLLSAALLLFSSSLAACDDSEKPDPNTCEEEPCVTPLNCTAGTYDNGVSSTCVDCLAGHWCAGGQAAPAPHTVCGDEEIEASPPSSSADRVCEGIVACTDEQAPRVIDGTITNVANANTCCHLHVGDLTINDGDGWPTFDESCLVVQGNVNISGPSSDNVGLVRVEGSVNVSGYEGEDLSVISELLHIEEALGLSDLAEIEDLAALASLQIVRGRLSLSDLPNVANFTGLSSLHTLGGLELNSALHFSDYKGLSALTVIGEEGFNTVGSSTMPADYSGMEQIEVIEGDFFINDQTNLESFKGWDSLKAIGGYFAINNAGAVEDFTDFSSLSAVSGGLSFVNNLALASFAGLERITETDGQLVIGGNNEISDLNGLEELLRIDGNVSIRGNARLCPSVAQGYLDDPERTITGNKLQTANGTAPGLICL